MQETNTCYLTYIYITCLYYVIFVFAENKYIVYIYVQFMDI